MLVLEQRTGTRQPITADQIVGNFAEQTVGYAINYGKSYGKTSGRESYWVTVSDGTGSKIMNLSAALKAKVDVSLDGVTSPAKRQEIFLQAISEGSILKVADNNPDGTPKVDENGNPKMRYLLSIEGTRFISAEEVAAAVAKAASSGFSIKKAMINRI